MHSRCKLLTIEHLSQHPCLEYLAFKTTTGVQCAVSQVRACGHGHENSICPACSAACHRTGTEYAALDWRPTAASSSMNSATSTASEITLPRLRKSECTLHMIFSHHLHSFCIAANKLRSEVDLRHVLTFIWPSVMHSNLSRTGLMISLAPISMPSKVLST